MKDRKLIAKIVQVAFHRNGIGGNGFHAVIFETANVSCGGCNSFDGAGFVKATTGEREPCIDCGSRELKEQIDRMVAAVFDEPGSVAVFAIAPLSDPAVGIAFGANSYRGDRYEPELRAAIREHQSDGSVRVGPFAIPTERKP